MEDVSKFDTLGTFELHVWTKEIDLTRRCILQFLTLIHDLLRIEDTDEGSREKMDGFLRDLLQLMVAYTAQHRRKKPEVAEPSFVLSEADLERFYEGVHTPWFVTTWVSFALLELPQKFGFDPENEPDKRIDDDKLRRVCWRHYLNVKKSVVTNEDWLSAECTYRVFLIYNKLLLKDDCTDLEIGQVNAFLMKMVNLSEYAWMPRMEYDSPVSLIVNFPEFVTLVTDYFSNLHLNMDFTCEMILELFEFVVLGIIKKGFLSKRGHVRKNWTKRYFVLQMTELRYYEDKELTKLKGGMMMNRNTILVNVRNADSPTHPRMFQVTCGASGKEFCICAEDERTKQSWMLAIQKALALTKIKNPLNRDELVSSIAQFSGTVYGDSLDRIPHPRPTSNTISLQHSMSQSMDESLKMNRRTWYLEGGGGSDNGGLRGVIRSESATLYERTSSSQSTPEPEKMIDRDQDKQDQSLCTDDEDKSDCTECSYLLKADPSVNPSEQQSSSSPSSSSSSPVRTLNTQHPSESLDEHHDCCKQEVANGNDSLFEENIDPTNAK